MTFTLRVCPSATRTSGGKLAAMPSAKVMALLTEKSTDPQARGAQLLELMFPPAYRAAHPDYARSFPIPKERMDPKEIGFQDQAIGAWVGVGDRLKSISAPAPFVTGTEDEFSPPTNALRMASLVPGSLLMRFAGAGHALMYQEPTALAESVNLFLQVEPLN